jgi:hypothetical protein
MTFPGWTRVTDRQFYVDSNDLEDEGEEDHPHRLPHRLYRPKGRRFPLLSIGLYPDWQDPGTSVETIRGDGTRVITHTRPPPNGFTMSVSFKPGKGQWWDDRSPRAYVPLELCDDLAEMIEEARRKIILWRGEP